MKSPALRIFGDLKNSALCCGFGRRRTFLANQKCVYSPNNVLFLGNKECSTCKAALASPRLAQVQAFMKLFLKLSDRNAYSTETSPKASQCTKSCVYMGHFCYFRHFGPPDQVENIYTPICDLRRLKKIGGNAPK